MSQLLILYITLAVLFLVLLLGQVALGIAYLENRSGLRSSGCGIGFFAMCGGFLLFLGFVLLPHSYADFFLLESLIFSLGWSWLTACYFAIAFTERSRSIDRKRHKGVFLAICVLLVLVGVWIINHLAQNVLALVAGPAYSSGILQDYSWSGGRGSQYFARIDNVSYLIPDPAWLAPYQRGQQISFAYSTTSTRIAVAPTDIGVTVLGGCLIALAVFAWIVTLLGVGQGYRLLWHAFNKQSLVPPPHPASKRIMRRVKLSRRERHQAGKQ